MVWSIVVGERNEEDVFMAGVLDLTGTDHAFGVNFPTFSTVSTVGV